MLTPPPTTKSFLLVSREAAHAVKPFPQACTTNLTLTYENGLLSAFTSSLVILVGHLLKSTRSFFAWAGMSLIIFAAGIPGPKLLVHVKFNERLFDTCLIYIAQYSPDPRPSKTTQFTFGDYSHLLEGLQLRQILVLTLTFSSFSPLWTVQVLHKKQTTPKAKIEMPYTICERHPDWSLLQQIPGSYWEKRYAVIGFQ